MRQSNARSKKHVAQSALAVLLAAIGVAALPLDSGARYKRPGLVSEDCKLPEAGGTLWNGGIYIDHGEGGLDTVYRCSNGVLCSQVYYEYTKIGDEVCTSSPAWTTRATTPRVLPTPSSGGYY